MPHFSAFVLSRVPNGTDIAITISMLNWLHPGARISNAIHLMQTTELSVTQIAYEVGFVEMLTFAREFKKHTQMTPEEFKVFLPMV